MGKSCRSLAPDLGHALGRLDESRLVDEVALLFAPDRGLDHRSEVIVRDARAHQVAQRGLVQREEARAQAALGRQPDSVAGGAEGLADRGDEADATHRAVGEPVAGRRPGSRVDHLLERELVLDLLLDAAARHDLLVGPDVVSIERHELDEADLVALAVRESSALIIRMSSSSWTRTSGSPPVMRIVRTP